MSRRTPAAAAGPDRTEQNRAMLKQLVKIESNKSCADCKRNKHPRWASWSIGVFVCIRCSGIHRGMGTHISRVKSVDLDSWTDEQMQNMLRWGNARANKYWEHKLAEGHVPNEAKIENFIRTKYDSKRWVMDGPMPDPSTLDDGGGDEDLPLNVVREKAIDERSRSGSLRNGSGLGVAPPPPKAKQPAVDLFGDDIGEPTLARPSTTEPVVPRPGPPKATVAPPKQTKAGESLLGLDFFGGTSSAPPARPSTTGGSTAGAPGRADLKSSILSLYASKPAAPVQPQVQPQQPQSNMSAFAGMQSTPLASPTQPQGNAQSFGGLNDAFSSLSFTQPQQQTQPKPSAFSNLTSPPGHTRQPSAKSALSGGSFFDMKPSTTQPPKPTSPPIMQTTTAPRKESFGGDFGDFSSAASPVTSMKSPPATTSSMGDLFSMPSPPSAKPAPIATAPKSQPAQPNYSAFNLSSPVKPAAPAPAPAQASTLSSLSNMDAWGSNDAWATPDPPPQPVAAPPMQTSATSTFKPAPPPAMQTPFDSGWGDVGSPTKTSTGGGFNVQQDEEFGGWSHASPVATSAGGATKPSGGGASGSGGGFGGTSDDLFGNVWG